MTDALMRNGDLGPPGTSMPPGVCIWLTGPSGAGKSTVTGELVPLLEAAGRTVTVLDVVPLLEKTPGETTSEGKLRRKAFVAGLIADHGGVAVCVTISSRRSIREEARAIVGDDRFVEVHFDLPPEVAAARRERRSGKRPLSKRLRQQVRRLRVGVGAAPASTDRAETADVTVYAATDAPERSARVILEELTRRGLVRESDGTG